MILFINVFITNQRLAIKYNRYNLPDDDRLDIFKYSLASFAVAHPFTKAILHIKLDDDFLYRQQELEEFIYSEFQCPVELNWWRNETQQEWQNTVDAIEDDLIWFFCNDDHIFLDYNTELVEEIVTTLSNDTNPYKSCYLSHFPELLVNCYHPGCLCPSLSEPTKVGNFINVNWVNHDSIQIVNKELLRYWWFSKTYSSRMPRTDNFGERVNSPVISSYVPLREMVRHFEGYSHTTVNPHFCPPLHIPPGFFEHDMQLSFYEPQQDMWSCSPFHPPKAMNINGVDSQYSQLDLPLVWKNRFSRISIDNTYAQEQIIKARNEAIMKLALAHEPSRTHFPPREWLCSL